MGTLNLAHTRINIMLTFAILIIFRQIALQVTAYIGSAFLNQGGSYHPASHLTVHPEYDPNREGVNDVGIVKLRNAIQFGGDVQPINLPIGITVNAGDEATATGWGDISVKFFRQAQLRNNLVILFRFLF